MAGGVERYYIPLIKKSEAYSAIYTLYQKEGKVFSSFSCTAPLTGQNVVKFLPLTDVLITEGHGGVHMDVWSDTNGNGEIDFGEVKAVHYFDIKFLRGNLPALQEKPVKFWIDEGCDTVSQAEAGWYLNSPNHLENEIELNDTGVINIDMALRLRIVLNAIGFTGTGVTDSSDFLKTVFVEKKVIGEVLNISKENAVVYREKKNKEVKVTVISRPGNILFKLCILGDPSFGFFPDSLKNSLPKTHFQE
jgi:hypothetical protein